MKQILKGVFYLLSFKSLGNNPRTVEIMLSLLAWFNILLIVLTINK